MIRVFALLRLAVGAAIIAPAALTGATAERQQFDRTIERIKAEMPQNPRRAAAHAGAGLSLAAAIKDPQERRTAEAVARWLLAETAYRSGDFARAGELAAQALETIRAVLPGSRLEGEALLTSGSIHGSRAETAAALGNFQSAYGIFARSKDQRSQALALTCIAMLYVDAKDNAAATRYLDGALETYPSDPVLSMSILNSRGVIKQDEGRYKQANADFYRALEFAKRVGSPDAIAKLYRNIARNQLHVGQLAAADRSLAAARAASGRADSPQQLAVAAQSALQHGRGALAATLIGRAFHGVDLTRTDLPLRDAHETAVAIYRTQDQMGQALAHLQALKRLDDRATKLATQTSTALMAARFDSANQDAKIARLRDAERLRRAQEELQRSRSERTLWLVGAGATMTIIVLLLLGMSAIRRSRDQVSAANADLATTNAALGKALAAKSDFLATTSHEIRTPLNGILGMTEVMLADEQLAAATRERLGIVHGAGMTMRALVNDLLDAAKIETGNLTLERERFDLAAMFDAACRIWAEQARDKGLTFRMDLACCPTSVEGDATRVRQIVSNLLANALKFTDTGEVRFVAESNGRGVRITVSDTGIGIPVEQQEAVFESFRQGDASTTRQYGGTGLGLSICRNLARAMGGEVTMDSRVGEGTSVFVDLPLPIFAAPPAPCVSAKQGSRLLLVDRNPITAAMLRSLCAPYVGSTLAVATLEEAAVALAQHAVSHLLIDLPGAERGDDAAGVVAALAQQASGAKVLLLTCPDDALGRHPPDGIDIVLAKPVAGAVLVEAFFGAIESERHRTSLVSQAA